MLKIKIAATGRYLPEKILTNQDFIKEFGNKTSPKALERLLGTKEHYVAAPDEQCSDLVVKAAQDVLKKANLTIADIDRLIISVTPGDYIEPATFPAIHEKLGAQCPAMEIKASCVGWLLGVDVAIQYLANPDNQDKRILVLAGAIMSKTMPLVKVQHRAIFADGAGGILLEKSHEHEKSCIFGSEFIVLGAHTELIHWPAPWTPHPKSIPKEYNGYFYMGGSATLFQLLHDHFQKILNKLWKKTGLCSRDVDFAVIHQPTGPLFEAAVENSGIAPHKIAKNFAKYGNTVSAELPITLDEAIEEGQIKKGDIVLLVTYGAGITGGCMLLKY